MPTGDADFKKSRRVKARLQDEPTNRLPPHSIESEQAVLGCILLSPNDSLPICIDKFKGNSEVFYSLPNRAIYDCLAFMHELNEAIDVITVVNSLRDLLQLESVGGVAYLSSLPDAVPSAANLDYYVAILLEKFALRKMISTCTEAVTRAYEHQGEVDQLFDEFQHDALELTGLFNSQDVVIHAKPLVTAALIRLQEIASLNGATEGLTTGFFDLDKITGGLKGSELIVIGARPGRGKTGISLNIADHVAVTLGLPVMFFSLEMSSQSLMMRALCSRARVGMREIRNGSIGLEETAALVKARDEIGKSKLYIDDAGGLTIATLQARARMYYQRHGIRLFIVDYVQLVGSTRKSSNRQEEVGEVSRGVKAIAKELDVPVIVLAQLNREHEKEKGRKPRISDLREGGNLEGEADIIGLLYEPAKPEGVIDDPAVCPTNLLIGKNRAGETGDIQLIFMKKWTRFESAYVQPAPPTTTPIDNPANPNE